MFFGSVSVTGFMHSSSLSSTNFVRKIESLGEEQYTVSAIEVSMMSFSCQGLVDLECSLGRDSPSLETML